MSMENASSPAVQLFQKAHQQMVLLSRVDEQMGQLVQRRKTLLEELRAVQNQINDEFQRVIELPSEVSARLAPLHSAAVHAGGANGNPPFVGRIDEPALA